MGNYFFLFKLANVTLDFPRSAALVCGGEEEEEDLLFLVPRKEGRKGLTLHSFAVGCDTTPGDLL